MSSAKNRYESGRWLAGRFAAGKWRWIGVAAAVVSTKRTTCIGTSLERSIMVGTSTVRTEMIGTDP